MQIDIHAITKQIYFEGSNKFEDAYLELRLQDLLGKTFELTQGPCRNYILKSID